MTDYYPFGEIRVDQSLDSNGAPAATGYKNPYKFTGKELDTDIGLYYYGARYYNPSIGRFVSMDPWEGDIKDPQSLNKYSYVLNNPLKYTDPSGQCVWDLCVIESVSVAAAIVAMLTVAVGAYVVSNDPEIPAIVDNSPPEIVSEPMITPADMAKQGLIAIFPSEDASSPNTTTIPETNPPPSIESIPAQDAANGMNVMMQKENKPRSTLPRDKAGNYLPDPKATGDHTRLGIRNGLKNGVKYKYKQGATFNKNGNFTGRTDATDHLRGDHYNPHFHPATGKNSTKKGSGYKIKGIKYK